MAVKRASLGQLDFIDEGAVGAVYRTPYRLRGVPAPLAYKEYLAATLTPDEMRRAILDFERAVAFRESLSPADQADLDARTVWPLDVVTDGGRVAGGLMPLIPQEYFEHVNPPHLGHGKDVVRGLGLLCTPAHRALMAGYSQAQLDTFGDLVVRAAVLAQLIYAIARLHKHGMVYGDVSLKNAAFALDPPRVTLLDCDGVAALSDASRHQLHSPFFLPPECKPMGSGPHARGKHFYQDQASDVYKLALCVIRGLTSGGGATQILSAKHLVGVLSQAALDTINRALNDDPNVRPTAKDLYETLVEFVRSKTLPPKINAFHAVNTVLPRGEDVVFVWDVDNVNAAFLHGPNGFSTPVDPAWGKCTVTVDRSGVYELEVRKRGMLLKQASDFIQVFDMPEFDVTHSSVLENLVPQIPALQPVEIESVLRGLPQRPSIEIGSDFIPAISTPSAKPILEELSRLTRTVSPVEIVNRVVETHAPRAFSQVPELDQVAALLTSGTQMVQQTMEQTQATLKSALEDSTAGSVAAAVRRIEAQVARAHANRTTP